MTLLRLLVNYYSYCLPLPANMPVKIVMRFYFKEPSKCLLWNKTVFNPCTLFHSFCNPTFRHYHPHMGVRNRHCQTMTPGQVYVNSQQLNYRHMCLAPFYSATEQR